MKSSKSSSSNNNESEKNSVKTSSQNSFEILTNFKSKNKKENKISNFKDSNEDIEEKKSN